MIKVDLFRTIETAPRDPILPPFPYGCGRSGKFRGLLGSLCSDPLQALPYTGMPGMTLSDLLLGLYYAMGGKTRRVFLNSVGKNSNMIHSK